MEYLIKNVKNKNFDKNLDICQVFFFGKSRIETLVFQNTIASLTGSIPPIPLFTYENRDENDYLTSLYINNNLSLTTFLKGQFTLHSLPSWEIKASKIIKGVSLASLTDDSKIISILSSRPFIYYSSFQIINPLKRAPIQNGDLFTSMSFNNLNRTLVSCTNCGTICIWDCLSNEQPIVLTLPRNINFQSLSLINNTIAISTRNGQIYLFDSRNLFYNISKKSIDLTSFLLKEVNSSIFPNNDHRLDGICFSSEEPWKIGFQYINGPSGVFDLMTNIVSNVMKAPSDFPTEGSQNIKYRKQIPIYQAGDFIFGYSWSNIIQYGKKEINIPIHPVALAVHDNWDGLFTASYLGDIFHVF